MPVKQKLQYLIFPTLRLCPDNSCCKNRHSSFLIKSFPVRFSLFSNVIFQTLDDVSTCPQANTAFFFSLWVFFLKVLYTWVYFLMLCTSRSMCLGENWSTVEERIFHLCAGNLKGTTQSILRNYIFLSLADNWDMGRWRPGLERTLARLDCFELLRVVIGEVMLNN